MSDPVDMTTTRAPFIEEARSDGHLFVEQPYELYSENNHLAWRSLYHRMIPRWDKYAHPKFLEGIRKIALDSERVPRLSDINNFLAPLSGFSARAVTGYVPFYLFFDSLRERSFPTTITIRDNNTLDYLPEPDIFHDAAGHVPMHTDPKFADSLVKFGEVARSAVAYAQSLDDHERSYRTIESIMKGMSRFFWFTIEFGLMRHQGELKVYGSGLLSSYGEIQYAIESPEAQRHPFQIEWVINQYFEINHYQPLYFVINSFDELFEHIDSLEKHIKQGKLNNLSPGEPAVNEEDLRSFLEACRS
jgi:phenylalanine-4-hydroxylase